MMTYRFNDDGRKISLLGYGAMRMPTVDGKHANGWARGASNADIDQKRLNEQIKYMLDNGMNYFDTSPAYCRGLSEGCLGKALKASGYKREDYVIATKLSNFSPAQYPLEKCKEMFEKSLKELQTDYIDNYLLHSVGNGDFKTFSKRYLENGALDWCIELRKTGRIKNLGFSFHGDPKVFEWCMEHHDKYKWDFCLIQMNYVDWRHAKAVNKRNLNAKYLYDELTKRNIPVAIMEPLLGGSLAKYNYAVAKELTPLDPEASLAKWAFRFCGSHPNVMTVLSGMTFEEHIKENIKTFSPLKQCSEKEFEALESAAKAYLGFNTIPCTHCNYCMPCPYGLDIPAHFAFRNNILTMKDYPSAKEVLDEYNKAIPEPLRRAEHCTGCDRCISHCPQSINISKEIAKIDEWIDGLIDKEIAK